ncbi:15934_t:CDS:1 [Funneliformis geosporum]|uniref:2298_t:CDS:1 n=1 Tax=Funneliformis geosporum TaxID=1117311 RepID=A0A9W4SSV4_9GLOM|nr:2298_t:CDS:1 [Funneliformis geosporum]CAI2180612.1 15934_t:CDS:1 [Funneliformis geosporum]
MNSYVERPIAPSLPPESMIQILKHLENDIPSLHSCVLVNRHWCITSVPRLWFEPFTSKLSENSILSLLQTYFRCLKYDQDKISLSNNLPLPQRITTTKRSPFFKYASFLKSLNTRLLGKYVSLWINSSTTSEDKGNVTKMMLRALYKLFIESGAKLDSLTLDVSAGSMDIAVEISLIKRNLNFISNIRKLVCIFSNFSSSEVLFNLSELWNELPNICKRIRILDVDANDMHWTSGQTLVNLIESQKELSNVKFRSFGSRVTSAVATLAKKSETLTSLEFECIDFRKVSLDGLEHCTKLETIRFIGGKDCDIETFRPLIKAKCKIRTLELIEISDYESVLPLLEKVGWSLEHLIINPIKNSLVEALPRYCPNITYLNISIASLFISHLLLLVSGCQLEYLVIHSNSIEDTEIILNEMGKVVPPSLHYLELLMPLTSDQLNTFLMHCRAPLKKLVINSYPRIFLTDSHIDSIKRFAIRKGTLKYVNLGIGGLHLDFDSLPINGDGSLKFLSLDDIVVKY